MDIKRSLSYEEEAYRVVKYSKERIRILIEEIRKRPDSKIYIAFNEIEHGEYIFDELWKCADIRQKLDWCHGTDPERLIKIDNFRKGRIKIFVCSLIMKQSINIPDINAIILMLGGKSKINVKQILGRLLRDDGVSKEVDFIDFYDVGKWVEPHSRKRIRFYIGEEFDITYHYPHRKNGLLKRNT